MSEQFLNSLFVYFVWANLLGEYDYVYAKGFVIDTNSFIYIATQGGLLKYTSSGTLLWKKSVGNWNQAITSDEEGNLYIVGGFMGYADFDPDPNSSYKVMASTRDIFNLKLDNEGRFIWVATTTGAGMSLGLDLIVDECHNVYSCGEYSLVPDFDPGLGVLNLRSVGHRDAFVMKLSQRTPPYITIDTFILGVSQSYASYQWYLNGNPIPGAIDSTYFITENGDYTVVVTNSKGCVDTAELYKVTNVYEEPPTGIDNDPAKWDAYIRVYPNPVEHTLYIQAPTSLNISITSIDGRQLLQKNNATTIDISQLAQGVYLLRMTDKDRRLVKTEKITKR